MRKFNISFFLEMLLQKAQSSYPPPSEGEGRRSRQTLNK